MSNIKVSENQQNSLQGVVSDSQLIGYLDNLGLTKKLTEGEKNAFIEISKAFGLNPFKREIYVSKYGETMSIITGYEVYIKRAERSGQLDGWSVTTTGSVSSKDLKAIVTIHRKDRTHPFVWEALYEECVQRTNQGAVTKFWQKASFMTKKVAISQAFRLCFSDELGGIPYTADEIQDANEEKADSFTNYEEVEEITEADTSLQDTLKAAETLDDLSTIWKSLTPAQKKIPEVLAAKDARKAELS